MALKLAMSMPYPATYVSEERQRELTLDSFLFAFFLIELRVVNDRLAEVEHNGNAVGEVMVRGPTMCYGAVFEHAQGDPIEAGHGVVG